MPLSSLTAPLFALFTMLGGFNWQYGAQTDEKGTAWVELSAVDENADLEVTIKGSDGSELKKKVSIKAGKSTKITWKQKDRQVTYDIEIQSGDAFTNETFEVLKPIAGGKQGVLELLSDRDDIVERQKIRYKTPFTASSHQLEVYNTDGDMVAEKLVTDQVVDAGGSFEMTWVTTDEVFMIKVTAEDESGYSATDTRVPYGVSIPHIDVNFDSGKSVIKPDEEHKVAESFAVLVHELERLDKATAAVNATLIAQLYVVGYTDTVGNGADNKKLSEERAKAIAKYFYDKGAWCEIYYAGMGENGLAVETGDSVDEVRNRRASYLLEVEKKPTGGGLPSAGAWKQLTGTRARTLGTLPELPASYVAYKEEQQQQRNEKFGGGSAATGDGDVGDGDAGSDDEGGDSGDGGSASDSGSSDSGSGNDSGGPPEVDEGPGANTKGCAVESTRSTGWLAGLAGLFGLLGLRRRRRG